MRSQLYPYQEASTATQLRLPYPPDYDKILVEQVIMSDKSLSGTIVHLPVVYGVEDYIHRLYPYIKRMDDQRPAIVLEASYANWRGSYGYVENVAAAIVLAVTDKRAAQRIYNVSESFSLSQAELIREIGKIVSWDGEVVIVPKSSLPEGYDIPLNTKQDWLTDSTRIRRELGYNEPIDWGEALRRTIDWERANPPEIFSAIDLLDYGKEDEVLAAK